MKLHRLTSIAEMATDGTYLALILINVPNLLETNDLKGGKKKKKKKNKAVAS